MDLQPNPPEPEVPSESETNSVEFHFIGAMEVINTRWWIAYGFYSVVGGEIKKVGFFYGNYVPHLSPGSGTPPKQIEP